jgi:hypothetical protein
MKRSCVAECCKGSWVRRFLVNLLFSASRRANSELEDKCNKQDFEKDEQMTAFIAT